MTNQESLVATARRLLRAEQDLFDGLTAFNGKLITKDEWTALARRSNETIRANGAALARYTLAVMDRVLNSQSAVEHPEQSRVDGADLA